MKTVGWGKTSRAKTTVVGSIGSGSSKRPSEPRSYYVTLYSDADTNVRLRIEMSEKELVELQDKLAFMAQTVPQDRVHAETSGRALVCNWVPKNSWQIAKRHSDITCEKCLRGIAQGLSHKTLQDECATCEGEPS